jgi:hypothetical protein
MNRPKQTLDQALAGLGTQRQPDRDLWPAIAREISGAGGQAATDRPDSGASGHAARGAPATARRPLALVASVAVLGLAASLAWNFHQLPPAPQELVGAAGRAAGAQPASLPAEGATPVSARFAAPDDAHYRAARAELEQAFTERLGLLAPETRTRIEADLAAIRAANADIRAALDKDPASPLLLQLLHSTGQQEIDLYKNVARATAPMANRRTRT